MTDAIFTPKPFAEIAAAMIEQVRVSTDRLTDFNVGSVIRTLLEANAVELDDYYQAVYQGLLRAIPTAIYLGFGFERRAAIAASGTVVFTRVGDTDAAVTIAQGTELVSLGGLSFVTDAALTIESGATTGTVTATAAVTGAGGNVGPQSLSLSVASDTLSATNQSTMAGGADEETEEQRAERFAAFVRALARGTPAALEYGATEPALYHPVTGVLAERATRASCEETPGHVNLWIHNGSYGASAALVAAVQQWIDGYRDQATDAWVGGYGRAGMRVDVLAMIETPVDVAMEITRRSSVTESTLLAAIRGALERMIRTAKPGDLIRPVDLINAALKVDGVLGASVLSPTTTTTCPTNAILYLDELAVTWRV